MSSAKRHALLALRTLLLLAPLFWAAMLVGCNGVDVPYTDQWDGEEPLFARMAAGTLGVGNFFAQHNEHRIFFPRLIFFGLARLTHWNVCAEMWFILGLAAVIAFNVWRIMRATGRTGAGAGFWLFFAANVLIFSPLHRENMLNGFQIGFLLPLACASACAWVGVLPTARARFAGTMALSVVCTFSIASGFTCWLLSLPLLAWTGGSGTWTRDRRWWLAWAGVFAASVFLYFHGYVKPPSHPDPWLFVRHPVDASRYGLTYLGLPFAFGTALAPDIVAQAAGGAMCAVLAAAAVYLWRERADTALMRRCLPWLPLAAIALVNAAVTMAGRLGFGLWQALASRYVAFAMFLPIGLMFIALAIHEHLRARPGRAEVAARVGMGLSALASALAVLHVLGACSVAGDWEDTGRGMLKSKALVETINVVDEPELVAEYVTNGPLREKAGLLDRIGYLHPPLVKSRRIDGIADVSAPVTAEFGCFEHAVRGPDHGLRMAGWAVLPDGERPADAVLLTYDDAAGQPIIFSLAETGLARADVAGARRTSGFLGSGWQKTCKPGATPPGAGTIKAWGFDADTGRAYRLRGQATVPE